MDVSLSRVANLLNTQHSGNDVGIAGISIDSRTTKPHDLFIAIKGAHYDGQDYLPMAIEKGASAALLERPELSQYPTIQVKDTQQALLDLARAWRAQFDLPVIAITGSCGKTSTRALLQSILALSGETLSSERSYNNKIGVPLTLLRLSKKHQFAVIEVGTNHPGEIAELVEVVQPTISVLTNAAASHLEGLGSVEGVAREKSAIFQTLSAQEVAIINGEDDFAEFWRQNTHAQVLEFGMAHQTDIFARHLKVNSRGHYSFDLVTPKGEIDITLKLIGKHNVANALAAAAVATALELPLSTIQQGIESAVSEEHRLVECSGLANSTIIDDSYNANPSSVQAAIEVLTERSGTSILVLGDMLELGTHSEAWHQKMGQAAKTAGIQHLFCFGAKTKQTVAAFGAQGRHFETQEKLTQALRPLLNEQVTVLVKGSKAMGMHQITQSLSQEL